MNLYAYNQTFVYQPWSKTKVKEKTKKRKKRLSNDTSLTCCLFIWSVQMMVLTHNCKQIYCWVLIISTRESTSVSLHHSTSSTSRQSVCLSNGGGDKQQAYTSARTLWEVCLMKNCTFQDLRREFENEARRSGNERLVLSAALGVAEEHIEESYEVDKIGPWVSSFNYFRYT